nr:uncharacterized protein LOC111971586 [Salvelinus alpinus]
MIGLMVMSYSIPLLSTEFTEVVTFGVPWWSGLSFIAAGVIAIVMEKHSSMKSLGVVYVVTLVPFCSLLALIIYFIDLHNNQRTPCNPLPAHPLLAGLGGVCGDTGCHLVSLLALIIYFIDLHNNPETPCNTPWPRNHTRQEYECDHQHYATVFSYGVKSSLLLFTIIQITISSTLSYILYKKRRSFGPYSSLNQDVPSTPILVTAPDFN